MGGRIKNNYSQFLIPVSSGLCFSASFMSVHLRLLDVEWKGQDVISYHPPNETQNAFSKESAQGILPCFLHLSHDIRFLFQPKLQLAARTEITLAGLRIANSSTGIGPYFSLSQPGPGRRPNRGDPRRHMIVRPAFEPKPCREFFPQRLSVVTSSDSSAPHSCELSSVVGGILAPKHTSNLNFDVSCEHGSNAPCSLCWPP